VSGVVRDDRGKPIAGAVLNVFQTDTNGHYTRAAVMDEPHARLFAFIRTGDDGRFEFTTIRPGAYPGRPDRQGEQWRIPAHVHFHVTAGGHPPSGFQMVFDDDSRMTPYWREWAARGHHPIVAIVRSRDGVQRAVCDITLRKAAANARRDISHNLA
jgi:protocatechuate 3,4-dioxygenase beta subunit